MATVPRNRVEKILPRIVGGKSYTLENYFHGKEMDAEQVRSFIRFWRDRQGGKMTLNGTKGHYTLHSNCWVEFEVTA